MVDSPRTADGGRDRLLLLDGHSLAYRAFYALPVENFSTTTGQPTNAVYGFTSMLINVLRDEQPTHVAVAFDVSRSTFRTAEYADYKANRTKAPDEFHGQVSLVKEVLDALQIRYLEADNYEADDVLATMASRAARGASRCSSARAIATPSSWSTPTRRSCTCCAASPSSRA